MHEIFLAGLDYEQDGFQTAAIRGIREIWRVLGADDSFGAAKSLVDGFIEVPTVMAKVGETDDWQTASVALQSAEEYHHEAATFVIDPDDLELPDPGAPDPAFADQETILDESDEGGPFSPAAYKTALVLISTCDGNPMMAYARAYQLGRTTDDQSLYQEVQAALMEVFELVFHPGGPQIHIIGEGE